jgi:glutaredoxin-like protein NrdH
MENTKTSSGKEAALFQVSPARPILTAGARKAAYKKLPNVIFSRKVSPAVYSMKKKKRVKLYALSTCVWCKRTKRLLKEMGVAYDGIDVDLLPPSEERKVRAALDELETDGGFPVMVIDGREVISGFDEDRIREALS